MTIVSFHPCFVAHKNLVCAGREPDNSDLRAIRKADAVILPQGCRKALYTLARDNCRNVFPNYDVRFTHPGKIGQSQLFNELKAPFPLTEAFRTVGECLHAFGNAPGFPEMGYPLVFKYDWGGEGFTVNLIPDEDALKQQLEQAETFENGGQKGFLLQKFVASGNQALRSVIIGRRVITYWRIQSNGGTFPTNVSQGARIDHNGMPRRQQIAMEMTKAVCARTGINLAGFDILFPEAPQEGGPSQGVFLEINYFFGRTGLGGSDAFYDILVDEINQWLERRGLSC